MFGIFDSAGGNTTTIQPLWETPSGLGVLYYVSAMVTLVGGGGTGALRSGLLE